ncbi:cation:dicarboxylase symporter family transporter [bacterium NHP-B]|nr:cation:dicarboxylase symporter family transporter [bacterium NHP-B]
MILKQLPFQLLVTIVFTALFGPLLPQGVLNVLYTIGMIFKDVLMAFIPLVVWGYLMSSMVSFDKKSLVFALNLVVLTVISSLMTALVAYGFSISCLPFLGLDILIKQPESIASSGSIQALWTLPFASPLTPSVAIVLALVLGCLSVFGDFPRLKGFAFGLRDHATRILKTYFIPLLPLYVMSVLLKIQSEGSLEFLFKEYGKIFTALYAVLFLMLGMMTFVVGGKTWRGLKNTIALFLKPGMTALTTMSGVAAMPFMVDSISKKTQNSRYAEFSIPLMTNIHTLGDGFVITTTAIAILYMTGSPMPTLAQGLVFVGCYTLARFFNACVPGGGILVMTPFVEKYLGLGPAWVGLLTTLYVLQDPLITFINTLGNGLLSLFVYPLFEKRLTGTEEEKRSLA